MSGASRVASQGTRGPATAETLVARCLLDPGFLDEHLREGSSPLTVDGEALDLRRLRLFGGLITKVQHNDLWEDFRYTRASLKLLEVELEFFADYRAEFLRARVSNPDRIARVGRFLDAVEQWLGEHWSPAAWTALDVVRYEREIWRTQLGMATCGGTTPQDTIELIRPDGVVTVVGFDHDPPQVMAVVRAAGSLADVPTRSTFLCFWGRPRPAEVRVLEVDGVTALVLDGIGAGVTGDGLRQALQQAHPQLTSDAIGSAIRAAVDLGLLKEGRLSDQPASEVHR
ncbi:MAG TPA: hypothetical protein VLA55_04990 [Ornithinibacter sp.]|nr:hypothetical protein [Ornithinibacter sp.]